MLFGYLIKVTLKIGGTAPLNNVRADKPHL